MKGAPDMLNQADIDPTAAGSTSMPTLLDVSNALGNDATIITGATMTY